MFRRLVLPLCLLAAAFAAPLAQAAQKPTKFTYESDYLGEEFQKAHRVSLVGKVTDEGGTGTLTLDPNACTLNDFGDPKVCTLIAPMERKVRFRAIDKPDPAGAGRKLYEVTGGPGPEKLYVVLPGKRGVGARLVGEMEKGKRRVVALGAPLKVKKSPKPVSIDVPIAVVAGSASADKSSNKTSDKQGSKKVETRLTPPQRGAAPRRDTKRPELAPAAARQPGGNQGLVKVRYAAYQVKEYVVVTAEGQLANPLYSASLKQSPARIWPPQFKLVINKKDGIAPQVIRPFAAVVYFKAKKPVPAITVMDAKGRHRVRVVKATEPDIALGAKRK